MTTNCTSTNGDRDEIPEESSTKTNFSPFFRQGLVCLGPIIITIALGMVEGYSAILLPQLQSNSSTIPIDDEDASWIASVAALPMPLGCIAGGIIMEKYGRKFAHQFSCIPCFIGWLIIYFSFNIEMLIAGRFFTGFCIGLLGPPTGVYISEISSPKYRGFFLALISFGIAFGVFASHLAGTYLDWSNAALICSSFPILAFMCMIKTPESPTFHANKSDEKKARETFHWCRGYDLEAKEEINVIIKRQQTLKMQPKRDLVGQLSNLFSPELIKPLAIIVIFFVVIQWSGLNAMTFYTVTIIQKTIGGNIDEYLAMLIVDTHRLFMSVVACILLRKIGRRPLALISGFGTSGSLIILSTYTYVTNLYPEYNIYYPVGICGILTFITFITIGFVPLPWIMMGEVFPANNRGVGSGISALTTYVAFFSVVKTTPTLFNNLGNDGTFLTYGLVAFFGSVFLYFFLPETKDKVLHHIEDNFKNTPNEN